MTARLMTPFCFASLLAAALIAEGALAPYIPAHPAPAAAPETDPEPATYADLYTAELSGM
ncbi:MAG: hypothetical protein Q8S09_17340 [Hyphomonas sp.]|nr:hypothetical protein [Hyphomonas sp.]